MRKLVERVLHRWGWMPAEREQVLEQQLQKAQAVADRHQASWESAEARIVELEWQLSEERKRSAEQAAQPKMTAHARQLVLNDQLHKLSAQALRVVA